MIKNVIKKIIHYSRDHKQLYVKLKKRILKYLILIKTHKTLIPPESFPRSLFIEVTGVCNLRCSICHRNYIAEELDEMKLDTFRKITTIFPFAESVNLMGIGEPLTNKNILAMISICKSYGLGVSFNTNGVLLTSDLSKKLIFSGLDSLVFSLDGATKEIYEKIRLGSNFNRVIENIKTFINLKKELNRKNPALALEFVVTTQNIHELSAYIDLAKDIGIGKIVVSHVIVFAEDHENEALYNHNHPRHPQIWNEAISKAGSLEIDLVLPSLQAVEDSNCRFRPWECFFVSWNGDVKPCCTYLHSAPLLYKGKKVIVPAVNFGNVNEENVLKLWYLPNYIKFRERIARREYTDVCRKCLYSKKLIPA